MNLSYFSYDWDYWELYHKVTFDGKNKLIIINENENVISVKTDIYSSWKEWSQLQNNIKYLPALRTIGGDPIGENLFAGDLYFLINGWQVLIPDRLINVNGVLFNDAGDSPYIISAGGGVISTVSQLVQTVGSTSDGGTGLSQQEIRNSLTLPSTRAADAGSIDQYINDLSQTSNNIDSKIDTVDSKIDTVDGKVDTIDSTVNTVDDKVDTINTKVSNIAPVINDIQLNINNLTLDLEQTQALLETLLKYQKNRTKVDPIAKTLTIYDDDGVTPIRTFDLLDSSGNTTTDYIYERVPK